MGTPRTFRAGFLFSGLGAGARGFLDARARIGEDEARFCSVGGIDVDAEACADFETLTRSPAVRADVAGLTPGALRAAWGERAPDCVFASPPCKGFSGLLSAASAERPEYQKLNRLVLQGIWLLLETWDTPPRTIVVENVPRIVSRGRVLLAQVRELLTQAGYRLHEAQHDCGEVGGLAQHRRRYLLVARLERAVSSYIYRPPRRRVRGCGEVLETLPLPLGGEGAVAGAMHALPRISWLTWLRLALIPPGGDWRDLPGVVPPGGARRAVWARYDVRPWSAPARAVAGEGSNGGFGVADPRMFALSDAAGRHLNQYRVSDWAGAAGTVIGANRPGSGAASVADPRVAELVGLGRTAERADSFKGRPGLFSVADWGKPSGAVTGSASPSGSNGTATVADPRAFALGCAPRAGTYGVLAWQDAAATITGHARVDNGRFAVADPRATPATPPVIRSPWDCWHRPMTTLELAALQGLPTELDGAPLQLAGRSHTRWRERVGNAVPVGAAQAIGESVLQALLAAALGTWTLSATGIWVRQDGRSELEWQSERV
jgi:site-specific DNA-cytosine methylase